MRLMDEDEYDTAAGHGGVAVHHPLRMAGRTPNVLPTHDRPGSYLLATWRRRAHVILSGGTLMAPSSGRRGAFDAGARSLFCGEERRPTTITNTAINFWPIVRDRPGPPHGDSGRPWELDPRVPKWERRRSSKSIRCASKKPAEPGRTRRQYLGVRYKQDTLD